MSTKALAQAAQPGYLTSAEVTSQRPIVGGMKGGIMLSKESVDILIADIERSATIRSNADEHFDNGRKWAAFRSIYKNLLPEIMGRKGNHYGIDPYFIDWTTHFTPIESDAWHTIRCLGLPLYPQFPVGNVFVDFGDPVKKIALECDGKAYHDAEKDLIRDYELFKAGWIVFRATGRECHKADIDLESMIEDLRNECMYESDFNEKVEDWALNTSDGLITAIGWKYYGKNTHELRSFFLQESLENHSSFYGKAA